MFFVLSIKAESPTISPVEFRKLLKQLFFGVIGEIKRIFKRQKVIKKTTNALTVSGKMYTRIAGEVIQFGVQIG